MPDEPVLNCLRGMFFLYKFDGFFEGGSASSGMWDLSFLTED